MRSLALDQKPCFVHYLQELNKFIIGTYQLFLNIDDARPKLKLTIDEDNLIDTLNDINFRAGKLILVEGDSSVQPRILFEFNCDSGGGIFDAKVVFIKQEFKYLIYVAHSNGKVGIYSLSSHGGYKIDPLQHIKILGSSMLTSIDLFPTDKELAAGLPTIDQTEHCRKIVVGDADGYITIIHGSNQKREKVTDGDSIWQVRSSTTGLGKQIIIVGADNSSWFIYEVGEELRLLYKNSYKDFSAGVTSIVILEKFSLMEEQNSLIVLLGSYDETLKMYQVSSGHTETFELNVNLKKTISIANGGIWRVKELRRNQFCIAAMYAGSYIFSLDNLKSELIDTDGAKLPEQPLHYDIDISCDKTYCIADFNNSLCLFKTGGSLL